MKLELLQENFWKNLKFLFIFTILMLLLYTVITRTIMKVPDANTQLLSSIENYEQILAYEEAYVEDMTQLNEEISQMKFDIYQVQKQDEIKKNIRQIGVLFNRNNQDSKYLFSKLSSQVLQLYYDVKEKESTLDTNIEVVKNYLKECKANI